jgi:hypothetical protein
MADILENANMTGFIADIASIVGLIISIITMFIVLFVDKKVKKLQMSNLFDQRINVHLTNIDKLQKELNLNMPNIVSNELRVKEILVQILVEFESLQTKLNDKKAKRKIRRLINLIQEHKSKGFYNTDKTDVNILDRIDFLYKKYFSNMISSRMVLDLYILINENYNRIQQVKLDKYASK